MNEAKRGESPLRVALFASLLVSVHCSSDGCIGGEAPLSRDFIPDGSAASTLRLEASPYSSLQVVSALVTKIVLREALGYRNVEIAYEANSASAPSRVSGCGTGCCALFRGVSDSDSNGECTPDPQALPTVHVHPFAMFNGTQQVRSRQYSKLNNDRCGLVPARFPHTDRITGYIDKRTRDQYLALSGHHLGSLLSFTRSDCQSDPTQCVQALASDVSNGMMELRAYLEENALPIAVAWLGSAYEPIARERLRAGVPTLVFDTMPQYALGDADVVSLTLPCSECNLNQLALGVVWSGMERVAPAVFYSIERLLLSPLIPTPSTSQGSVHYDLACQWVLANRQAWTDWQRGFPTCLKGADTMRTVEACSGAERQLAYTWKYPSPSNPQEPGNCIGGDALPEVARIPCDHYNVENPVTLVIMTAATVGLLYIGWIVWLLIRDAEVIARSGYSVWDRASRLAFAAVAALMLSSVFYNHEASRSGCTGIAMAWGMATDLMGYSLFSELLRARLRALRQRERHAVAVEQEEQEVVEDVRAVRSSIRDMAKRTDQTGAPGVGTDIETASYSSHLAVDLLASIEIMEKPRRGRRGVSKAKPAESRGQRQGSTARPLGLGQSAGSRGEPGAVQPPADEGAARITATPHDIAHARPALPNAELPAAASPSRARAEKALLSLLSLQIVLSIATPLVRQPGPASAQVGVIGHGPVEHTFCEDRAAVGSFMAIVYLLRTVTFVGAIVLALLARLHEGAKEGSLALLTIVCAGLLNEIAFSSTDTRLQSTLFLQRITTGGIVTIVGLTAFTYSAVRHTKLFTNFQTAGDESDVRKTFQRIRARDLDFMELLGVGAFGEVLRARYSGTDVAVKHVGSRSSMRDFANEMEAIGLLRHPNIVLFIGYCRAPRFLVMEYMPKGTLHSLLHVRRARIPPSLVLSTLKDIAKGLLFLHTRTPAMVHRDIKSPNVLYDETWRAKVSDFGLSRLTMHAGTSSTLSAGSTGQSVTMGAADAMSREGDRRFGSSSGLEGHISDAYSSAGSSSSRRSRSSRSSRVEPEDNPPSRAGSLLWLAPEVVRGEHSSTKADVYSFGVVMFEMLFRQLPYATIPSAAVPLAVISGRRPHDVLYTSDEQASASLSGELQPLFGLMCNCLMTQPMQRPDMSHVIEVLEDTSGRVNTSLPLAHITLEYSSDSDAGTSLGTRTEGDEDEADNGDDDDAQASVVSDRAPAVASRVARGAGNRMETRQGGQHLDERPTPYSIESSAATAAKPRVSNRVDGEGPLPHSGSTDAPAAMLRLGVEHLRGQSSRAVLELTGTSNGARGSLQQASVDNGSEPYSPVPLPEPTPVHRGQAAVGEVVMEGFSASTTAGNGHALRRSQREGASGGILVVKDTAEAPRGEALSPRSVEHHGRRPRRRPDPEAVRTAAMRDIGDSRPNPATSPTETSGAASAEVERATSHSHAPTRVSVSTRGSEPTTHSRQSRRRGTTIISASELSLGKEIGAGSFGRVYVGLWRSSKVAVKVIVTGKDNAHVASLVKQEVNMLARLSHPALLQLHGVCFTGMQTLIVTEFMDRGSLFEIYRSSPRTEPAWRHFTQAAEALTSLFSGLAFLHTQRPPMIHRDVKSPNILVNQPFQCKIADFGASRIIDSARTMTRTGTPMWVAPEVLRGERYTELCDVYSMCVVATELLNWSEPYPDSVEPHELMRAVALHGKRPTCKDSVPEEAVSIVQRGFADVDERPTAMEMMALWQHWGDALAFSHASHVRRVNRQPASS